MAHNYARDERAALCDLLAEGGPDRPTLCTGWRTRDLAAHLLVRERRPLAAPGIVLPPLAGYTERVRRRLAERPYPELVARLRRPPRWSPVALAPVDRAVNTLELFIHHEDARRGEPGWQPRELPPGLAAALWARVRPYAKLRLRRFPAPVIVHAPGHGEVRTGSGDRAGGGDGGEPVRLTADPGELALFLTGRQAAARVTLTGPEPLTGKLAAARLGL
jgi:uncharacterized protein (TIGR03085 family)